MLTSMLYLVFLENSTSIGRFEDVNHVCSEFTTLRTSRRKEILPPCNVIFSHESRPSISRTLRRAIPLHSSRTEYYQDSVTTNGCATMSALAYLGRTQSGRTSWAPCIYPAILRHPDPLTGPAPPPLDFSALLQSDDAMHASLAQTVDDLAQWLAVSSRLG